jgi:hypothetical protein
MSEADLCNMIAGQVSRILQREMGEGAEFQHTQRSGPNYEAGTKAPPETSRLWRTVVGNWRSHDIGPDVVPFTTAERLSLQGNIAHIKDASGRQLVTLTERFTNVVERDSGAEVVLTERGNRRRGVRGAGLSQLTKEESENFISVMEGRTLELDQYGIYKNEVGSMNVQPISEKVAHAVGIMRQYLKDSSEELDRTGVMGYKAFWKPENYWPIMHETSVLKTQEFQRKTIDGMALKIAKQDGRSYTTPNDYAAATAYFDHYGNKQYAKVGANIQRERTWDVGEGRITDPMRVFELYSQQKMKALYEKRIFGDRAAEHSYPDLVQELRGAIVASDPRPRIRQQVDAYISDTFGIVPSDPTFHSALMQGLNGIQGLKLSLSVVKNASQTGNTWLATNGPSTLRAISAYIKNSEVTHGIPARDFAAMMGSVGDQAAREATLWSAQGFTGRAVEQVLRYTGFTKVEQWNRSFAGIAGSFYAEQQAKLYAATNKQIYRRQLIELGITPDRAVESIRATGGLMLEDKLLAGQKIINSTQFRARQADLPFFATQNPDLWRSLLTFRTFSLNQVRLMHDLAHKRPGRVLLFGSTIMPAIGMGINFAHDVIYNDIIGAPRTRLQDNQTALGSYLEAAGAAGSFGMISDAFYTAYMAGENQSFKNFFVPPAISTADDMLMITGQIARGRFPQAARTIGRQLGGLGAAFTRATFGLENE